MYICQGCLKEIELSDVEAKKWNGEDPILCKDCKKNIPLRMELMRDSE